MPSDQPFSPTDLAFVSYYDVYEDRLITRVQYDPGEGFNILHLEFMPDKVWTVKLAYERLLEAYRQGMHIR